MKTRLRYLMAPDDGGTPQGGSSPALAPAAPVAAPEAAPSAPEPAQPSSPIGLGELANKGDGTKVISASKALGLPEASESIAAEIGRIAGRQNKPITVPTRKKVEKPAAEIPAKPPEANPAKPPEPAPEPPKPTLPAKIKVGDKEYTAAELQELIADHLKSPEPAAPTPKPEDQPTPTAKTPEQIEADRKAIEERDNAFVTQMAQGLKPEHLGLTSETLDKILSGGEEAVTAFTHALGVASARASLETRKALANEINMALNERDNAIKPLLTMHEQVERYQETARFETAYPQLKGREQAYNATKAALMKHYPEQVSKMTEEEFQKEIAGHIIATAEAFGSPIPPLATSQEPKPPAAPPAAVAPPAPTPAPNPTPAPASPPPPRGQIGGTGTLTVPNDQRSMLKSVMASQGITI